MSHLHCGPMKKVHILYNMSYVRKCMRYIKCAISWQWNKRTKIGCLQLVDVRRLKRNKNFVDTKSSRIYIKYIQFLNKVGWKSTTLGMVIFQILSYNWEVNNSNKCSTKLCRDYADQNVNYFVFHILCTTKYGHSFALDCTVSVLVYILCSQKYRRIKQKFNPSNNE